MEVVLLSDPDVLSFCGGILLTLVWAKVYLALANAYLCEQRKASERGK